MYEPSINEPFVIIISVPGVPSLDKTADICRLIKQSGQKITQTAVNNSELCHDGYRAIMEYEKKETGILYDGMIQPKINTPYPCPDWLGERAIWQKGKRPDLSLLIMGIVLIIGTSVVFMAGFISIFSGDANFYTTFLADPSAKCYSGTSLVLFLIGAIFIYVYSRQVK